MSSTEEFTEDSNMIKVMGIVIAALLVLSLCIGGVANLMGGGSDAAGDSLLRNALVERIQPVGAVRTSAEDLPEAATVAVADASAAPRSAEELVGGACAACHQAGVGGAPLLNDEEAWAQRREAGLDALVASVINGKGSMPARGGSDYSDEEIRIAVQAIALFEDTGEAEAPESETTPALTEDSAEAADTTEAAPEAAADTASVAAVTPVVIGQAPENLPEHVKTTVDGVCSGCHIAGVANAPKIGDVAAWEPRAALGLEALTATVISGKGAMPARGGSNLTDEEIAIAVQYLMSK